MRLTASRRSCAPGWRRLRSLHRALRAGAFPGLLALAACGQTGNGQVGAGFVTVGGTVTGLAGTVTLQNNGGNSLVLASNGSFTFSASFAPGGSYAVTVLAQPQGQACAVANSSGTANANVANVAVNCMTITLRALPAVYSTGKAVNYSSLRTAAGPGVEVPTDAQLKEDLALLHAAGYRLLRLFGSDPLSERVLTLAATNFPDMQFQLGVYLFAIDTAHGAGCDSNATNTAQITTGIRLANQYPNVATVSVGNETSFFRQNMPVVCLAGFIQAIRSQVAQPLTADDDYGFYCDAAAVSPPASECSAAGAADAILAITDFVSIHTYPMSNPGRWDPAQAATAAGPGRAQAMMEAALASAKRGYAAVAGKTYRSAAGNLVSVGASLPIVIGETGWKARRTNYALTLEQYAATPMNAKWYADLLYGSAPGATLAYAAWEGSAGGPKRIFYFEGFDEIWKGEGPAPAATDDGWGLWGGPDPTVANYGNLTRTGAPRYILCGAYASFSYAGVVYPAAPACNIPETYPGAGYLP
jgi:exo-beta-1,3-glucanase (GH17 family)